MRGWLAAGAVALMLLATPGSARGDEARIGRTVSSVEIAFSRSSNRRPEDFRYLVEDLEQRPFDPSALSQAVEDLYRLGLFRQVEARIANGPGDSVILRLTLDPREVIARIRFRGNQRLSNGRLESVLGKSRGDPYSSTDPGRMVRRLTDLYRSEGFLAAQVTWEVGRIENSDRMVLRFTIDEGVRTRISEIRFNDIAVFPERMLLRKMQVKTGRPFRLQELAEDLESLRGFYRDQGYPSPGIPAVESRFEPVEGGAAVLYYERRGGVSIPAVTVSPDGKQASLRIFVVPGQRVDMLVRVDWRTRWPELSSEVWAPPEGDDPAGKIQITPLGRIMRRESGLRDTPFLHPSMVEDAAEQIEDVLHVKRRRNHARAVVESIRTSDGRFEAVIRVEAGPRVRLAPTKRSDVNGLDRVSLTTIRQVLNEASPLIRRGVYKESDFLTAVNELQRWFRSQGYLDATVTAGEPIWERQDKQGRARRVRVPLTVSEGERRTVSAVRFHGAEDYLSGEELDKLADRLRFEPYNRARIEEVERTVRARMREQGLLDASVRTGDPSFSDDGKRVSLDIYVEPGAEISVGTIFVLGNRHTRVGLIQREVRLRSGDLWIPSALETTRRRLVDLGLFRSVRLEPVQTEGRVRDLRIEVRERPRVRLKVGGGIDTDRGFRLLADLTLLNPLGVGQRLSIRAQAGLLWEALEASSGSDPDEVVRTAPDWRLSAVHTFPYIGKTPLRISLRATLNELMTRRTFTLSRYSVGVAVTADFSDRLQLIGAWEIRWRYPFAVDPAAQLAAADRPDPQFEGFPSQILFADRPRSGDEGGWRRYNVFSLSGLLDLRDDPINPVDGVLLVLDGQAAPPDPGSGEGFGRFTVRTQAYLPLRAWLRERVPGWPINLRLRARAGLAEPLGSSRTVPIEERVWLGGADSVRGYRSEAVGPWVSRRKGLTTPGFTESFRRVPVGGDTFVVGTFEIAWPWTDLPVSFLRPATLSVFVEGGVNLLRRAPDIDCAADKELAPTDCFSNGLDWPAFAVGIGFAYRTPIGPIRLDLGIQPIALRDRISGQTGRYGGLPEFWRGHVSVGSP